jgi:hypothetical protein
LQAAFVTRDTRRIAEFRDHFTRFLREDTESLATCLDRHEQARLHYLHLAAHFCRGVHNAGLSPPPGLAGRLFEELAAHFTTKRAWFYQPRFVDGGSRARLALKFEKREFPKSYYRAVNDHELFSLASLGELRVPEFAAGNDRWMRLCDQAMRWLARIVRVRGEFRGRGWLFQPGMLWDHPDMAYAGHPRIAPNLQPKPRPEVCDDSFHAHRWSLFLRTLMNNAVRPQDVKLASSVLAGLERQFYGRVAQWPSPEFPAARMTNYMDGWNGVYRYAYKTHVGYDPYQLSGGLPRSWWGFLPGARSQAYWQSFAKSIPLTEDVIRLYLGPAPAGGRPHAPSTRRFFTNGFAELNVRLMAEYGNGIWN